VVSHSAAPLTSIGFRRDLKLFLFVLVGFFAALIFLLLLLLQTNLSHMEQMIQTRDTASADAAATEIRRILQSDGDTDVQLMMIPTRFGFSGVELDLRDGGKFKAGSTGQPLQSLERSVGSGTARFYFDATTAESLRRRFNLIASISLTAMALGIAMLFLYVPRILRPIDAMLEDARALGGDDRGVDEASYLIETFRASITTLKNQEAQLKTLHEREKARADDLQTITATLTRSLTSGLIALAPDHRLLELNAAAREILGLPVTESVAGREVTDCLGNNTFARALTSSASQQAPLSRQEVEIVRPEGPRTIGLTTVPLFNEAARFLGTLALFTDLTQVRRLESRVREMQTLADLGEMSAGIAHEFRNSLSTILGQLKLVSRLQPGPEVEAKINAVEAEAVELAQTVDTLLQFARPMRLQLDDVDLAGIIEHQVDRLRERTPAVKVLLDAESSILAGDAVMLGRAFENILRNAAEAAAENPRASVCVEVTAGTRPTITVSDNGPGISEEEAAKVFLPFHSTKPHGVGLGLPLARKIILLHGGSLRFDSRPGVGTTVTAEFEKG
jgi:signal transduction histidine kinase